MSSDEAQRNGLEKSLEVHFGAFKEYVDKRLVEFGVQFEKRFVEMDAKFEKRFVEMDAKFEKRFAEADVKMSQMQATLIRWMFTFFIGTVVTLATLFFSYIQVLIK